MKTDGERKRTKYHPLEKAGKEIRARLVSAYVLRLPYTLPPVLAVKTLLSIS